MPDDNEPQGPNNNNNPFIRFKDHVNARIGTGVSVLTRTTDDRDKALGNAQPSTLGGQISTGRHGPAHKAASSPCPGKSQPPGGSSRQSSVIDYWDDWCLADPYSPHNLQHLPQPTPRGLPSGADPAAFGFPEAFEDLMSASNPFRGHLMDLGVRAGLKRPEVGKPATPETPSAWVRRLYGDALLPPPLVWEQPRLARGVPRPRATQGEQPVGGLPHARGVAETGPRAHNDHGDIGDVARAYLEIMRRINGIFDEPSLRVEQMVVPDVAEILRQARHIADHAMEALAGERSENHDASSSDAKTQGGSEPASAGAGDLPGTEEDLFEMIQSVSAEADRSFDNFAKARPRQAPPPAERPPRDSPPVSSAMVEYDPSGGKTIRICSEHVDMFGFVHCRTDVRRLNAKGEMVDYDTRYSVRSPVDGSRAGLARREDYRPRSDAPVSVSMRAEQHSAFIDKSSEEQPEASRLSTAQDDEAALESENLALGTHQMQLKPQQRRPRSRNERAAGEEVRRANGGGAARSAGQIALEHHRMQMRLLEEQSRRILLMKLDAESEAAVKLGSDKPQESAKTERSSAKPDSSSGWFWR